MKGKEMKRIALATVFAFIAAVMTPAAALAQGQGNGNKAASPLAIPITGAGGGAVFTGTFQLQRFATSQGGLVANGVLTGIVTSATGVSTSVVRTVSLPAVIGATSCDILHLDLGPLALDILGLQINLSQVILDITAQSGAGNLLGNLLCAVANLLNSPGPLANLLNSILALLG